MSSKEKTKDGTYFFFFVVEWCPGFPQIVLLNLLRFLFDECFVVHIKT